MTISRPTGDASTRVAAIDIGTNSVLLLVAERRATDGALSAGFELATITRLGEGVDKTRELSDGAVKRTLDCLQRYAAEIGRRSVTRIDVVGTSAMRDARGGESFRRLAKEILGVEPRVIGGEEEARLTFIGGLSGLTGIGDGTVGVFDIGGGSTEFIRGTARVIDQSVSLDVGSVRLTERHVAHDPPSLEELAACERNIDEVLLKAPDLRGLPLVGIAGTVTTIAAVALGIDPYDGARVHGAQLATAQIREVAARLARTPLAERRQIPGLSPERADVIVAGSILCAKIVERAGAQALTVSDRGVRWGVAEELARSLPT